MPTRSPRASRPSVSGGMDPGRGLHQGCSVVVDGVVDPKAWTLCLVDRMRAALHRRDLFATPSLRYADPRLGLLDGPAWEVLVLPSAGRLASRRPVPTRLRAWPHASTLPIAIRRPGAGKRKRADRHSDRRHGGAVSLRPRQIGGTAEPGRTSGGCRRTNAPSGPARVAVGDARAHRLCGKIHPCQRTRPPRRGSTHQHLRRAAGGSLQYRPRAVDPAGHPGPAPLPAELG